MFFFCFLGAGGTNTSDALSDTDSAMTASDNIKGEPLKTLLAGIFLIFAWVATTTSLALTHERLPEYNTSHDALPDLILDNIKYQSWGLDASEITIMICTWMAFLVTIFHKHRYVPYLKALNFQNFILENIKCHSWGLNSEEVEIINMICTWVTPFHNISN